MFFDFYKITESREGLVGWLLIENRYFGVRHSAKGHCGGDGIYGRHAQK